MLGSWKVVLSVSLLSAIGGFLIAQQFFPSERIVVKTEIQEVEKVVEKDKIVTKKVVEVKKPDGTVVTSTTDKVEEKDKVSDLDRRLAERVEIVKKKEPNWGLGVLVAVDSRMPGSTFFGGSLSRRVIGNLWVTGFGAGSNDGAMLGGVGLTLKF